MKIGNDNLPQSMMIQTPQDYANKSMVWDAQVADALNSDFLSSWFHDKDDFTLEEDKETGHYIESIFNNPEGRPDLEQLYNDNVSLDNVNYGRDKITSKDDDILDWAKQNPELVLTKFSPSFLEKRKKELELKKSQRKHSLEFTRRNMMDTELAYENNGGSAVWSVISGMGAYLATPTGAAEMLIPFGPTKGAILAGSRYARTQAAINSRALQGFKSETAMVAGIEGIIGYDEYQRNKELGMSDERIIQDAVGRIATPFLAGALRGVGSKVIDEINLWGIHGIYTNNEKTFMRDVLIADGVSRLDAEKILRDGLAIDKKGRKVIAKNADSRIKAVAEALEGGKGYKTKANILTDEAKTRLGLKDTDTIEIDAGDFRHFKNVNIKFKDAEGVDKSVDVNIRDILKERELESDTDFTPNAAQKYNRVVISVGGNKGDVWGEGAYGKLSEDEIKHIKDEALDAKEIADGQLVVYVKDDATDLYGKNIIRKYGTFNQEADGKEWPDIKEMVSISKDKFDSVKDEFLRQAKRIYQGNSKAVKDLEEQFYGDELISADNNYLIDVNKLSSEAKLALAFPEMMARQEGELPLLFTQVKGKKVTGFKADERLRLFNRAKLDENGAFVLFNFKPEGDTGGGVPHRVIYSDGKGNKKNTITVYRAQRNLWQDDTQIDIGPNTGIGHGEIAGIYTSTTFEGNKNYIAALGRNESITDNSVGYSYELVVGREDGTKIKEIVFENKITLNEIKNLIKVIDETASAQDRKDFHLNEFMDSIDKITAADVRDMTWGDFFYKHVGHRENEELKESITRFLQNAGYDIIRRSKGLPRQETILLNQNLIREVRLLNVRRTDRYMDVERIPFPYETNDIFKGGRIVTLAAKRQGALSKIKRGVKGIIKAEEIDDDTISGLFIGGRYNEETKAIEGDDVEYVAMGGMNDLIENGIEPRVIHIPGIVKDKAFTPKEIQVMKFYYEMVLDTTLAGGGRERANILHMLYSHDIMPTAENKAILYNIRSNKSNRNMADYMVNKNLETAIDILENYDESIFKSFDTGFKDFDSFTELVSSKKGSKLSLMNDDVFYSFNKVYLSIKDKSTRKIFFSIIDKDENVLPSLFGAKDDYESNLVLLKNVLESDMVSRRKDVDKLPKKELDRIYNKYIAVKQFIKEMEANLKSTPAQWKVIARMLKGGGVDTELDLIQFDEIMKVLRDRKFRNVKTADEVKEAFMRFEPLPVNAEGKIVLTNKYMRAEAKEGDDGDIEFVKTAEITVLNERTKKYEGISDMAIISKVSKNKNNEPEISILYRGDTHKIKLVGYKLVDGVLKYYDNKIADYIFEEDGLLRAITHKYKNTSKLTGQTAKFEEIYKDEIYKHVDKLGRRWNLVKITDEQWDLTLDGKKEESVEFSDFDEAKAYVSLMSREIDLDSADGDELVHSVHKCLLRI